MHARGCLYLVNRLAGSYCFISFSISLLSSRLDFSPSPSANAFIASNNISREDACVRRPIFKKKKKNWILQLLRQARPPRSARHKSNREFSELGFFVRDSLTLCRMPRSPQGRLRNRSRPAACVYLNTCRTAHIWPRVICTCTAVHASVPRPLGHGPARPWLCECMRAAARSIHGERAHHAKAPLEPCRMLESFGDTACTYVCVR